MCYIEGGFRGRKVGSVMALKWKVFHLCSQRRGDDPLWLSPNSPLWYNRSLGEFMKLSDGPKTWAKYGIKYLHQICRDGRLCMFTQLREQFGVPRSWLFRYAKLRHAAYIQFGGSEIRVQNTDLERVLIDPDVSKRISRYYGAVGPGQVTLTSRARGRWEMIVPELSEELWQEVLDTFLVSVISSTDRMIQYRYLHQQYYTQTRLHRMHGRDSATCHKCGKKEGTFVGMYKGETAMVSGH